MLPLLLQPASLAQLCPPKLTCKRQVAERHLYKFTAATLLAFRGPLVQPIWNILPEL